MKQGSLCACAVVKRHFAHDFSVHVRMVNDDASHCVIRWRQPEAEASHYMPVWGWGHAEAQIRGVAKAVTNGDFGCLSRRA